MDQAAEKLEVKMDSEANIDEITLQNESLKTQIMVLNQKLRDSEERALKSTQYKMERDELRNQCDKLREELQMQESEVYSRDFQI